MFFSQKNTSCIITFAERATVMEYSLLFIFAVDRGYMPTYILLDRICKINTANQVV